jgi:hypothetical protein
MSTGIIRLTNFNSKRVATLQTFNSVLQQLDRVTDDAIKQQVYAVKNPDGIIDEEFKTELLSGVAELVPEFLRISEKIQSIIKTANNEMTVDDLHLNNDFSLADYSSRLLR